jgi:hypothetical protein
MKFDTLVEKLLLEMPHASFNYGGKIFSVDLEMEKYQNNYEGFIQHVKNLLVKINNDNVKKEFKNELLNSKQFILFLEKLFQKSFDQFVVDSGL